MNNELGYNFLNDLREFEQQFNRVLNRTPHERAGKESVFWTRFFLGFATAIQNSKLGQKEDFKIKDVCFRIIKSGNKGRVLKLAFKVNKDGEDVVILRALSVGESDSPLKGSQYSEKEIKQIEQHFLENNENGATKFTIELETVDSKVLHLNPKTYKIVLQDNNEDVKNLVVPKDAIKKVKPLENITFDTMLDGISNPSTANEVNVKDFFAQLTNLYGDNGLRGDNLEAASHGFTYGVLTLIYKQKYALDIYSEQSAGKGFLDIGVIFRKMLDDNGNIKDTNAGSNIIGEFKKGDGLQESAEAAVEQIQRQGYNYNLYGRTDNKKLIAVGLNFERKNIEERVKIDLELVTKKPKSFIAEVVGATTSLNQDQVKDLLEDIYYSIRKEERLELVLIGDLFAQSNILEKKIFTINQEELPGKTNTKINILSFNHNNQRIIVTITDTDEAVDKEYEKTSEQQSLERTRSKTKDNVKNNPAPIKTTIAQELDNVVTDILREGSIDNARRIDITINSNFEDTDKESYLKDIKVQDISSSAQSDPQVLTKYTPYACDIEVDTQKLLEELITPQDSNTSETALNQVPNLKQIWYKLKDLIVPHREAGVKAFIHGLYIAQFKSETTLGHGRADGVVLRDNDQPALLEFKYIDTNNANTIDKKVQEAVNQGKNYLTYLKSITNAKMVSGGALIFNAQAGLPENIMIHNSFDGKVAHDTTDAESSPEVNRVSNIERDQVRASNKVSASLDELGEEMDNLGLRPSGSNCANNAFSARRLKRSTCQEEEENERKFPYEPLEENTIESSKINARLYAQIAYLIALKYPDAANQDFKPDNVFVYNTNIGDIISEREINHSLREQKLLQNHYQEAEGFLTKYPKDMLLNLVGEEGDLSSRAWIFSNGKQSLSVSYDGSRYQIYSQDLHYRQSFQTKEGVSFEDIELFADAFFKWRSDSVEYNLYTLKSDIPIEIITEVKQAKFWTPSQVVSDLVLLDKGSFSHIGGIPAKVVRELFLVDDKVPELAALHEDFFTKYLGRISIKVGELHDILSSLDSQANESLVKLVKQYNFPVDATYLANMPEDIKSLLYAYHNEVNNKLQTSELITIQELSDLSWKIVADKMSEHPDISSELKESSLKEVKKLQSFASTHANKLGITSQILFFLPDVVKSINTGNFEELEKTGAMILGDMAFNEIYGSLISKLESVLPESRIALLKSLPVTSPIFKILTVYSIVELHQELSNLPPDSEKADIIKHRLGEQYFTVGLIAAELFGLELGPVSILLWAGLIAEQLIYGPIALRKEYHLDIPFGKAFLMSLGFEEDEFHSILSERQLANFNLLLVNKLSAQTNTSHDLVIVKVPKISHNKPEAGDTVIEFKPQNTSSCSEDNVFLEENSGYTRIASVIIDEHNNNCIVAPVKISGSGLAALYSNNNNTAQQSIFVNFDPNEGSMKLHFTREGLKKLDERNNDHKLNATNPYVVTTHIYRKPYPSNIELPENKNKSFILNDDSGRVVSNYYIDATNSFSVQDNSSSTRIKFINPNNQTFFLNNQTLFRETYSYISGSTSNMTINNLFHPTGSILLEKKASLYLDLKDLPINDKFTIDIPNTEILHAKGFKHNRNNTIEISSNVIVSKISFEAYGINRIDFKNKHASDIILYKPYVYKSENCVVSIDAIRTEDKSYYTFTIDDLQVVLNKMSFTVNDFPELFFLYCGSRIALLNTSYRVDNKNLAKNIISIQGKIGEGKGILTIEADRAILEIVANSDEIPQNNKYREIINYGNTTNLENDLKYNKIIKYTANSTYYSCIYNDFTNWNIIEFTSIKGYTVLHHFKGNNIQINRIDYFIQQNKLYALPKDNIDASKLLIDSKGTPVPIFIDTALSDSEISLEENILEINNSTINNLSDNTIFVFQKPNNEKFSMSFKLLKDSFKNINEILDKDLSLTNQIDNISEIVNQIKNIPEIEYDDVQASTITEEAESVDNLENRPINNYINEPKISAQEELYDIFEMIQGFFIESLNILTSPLSAILKILPGAEAAHVNNTKFYDYNNYDYNYTEPVHPERKYEEDTVDIDIKSDKQTQDFSKNNYQTEENSNQYTNYHEGNINNNNKLVFINPKLSKNQIEAEIGEIGNNIVCEQKQIKVLENTFSYMKCGGSKGNVIFADTNIAKVLQFKQDIPTILNNTNNQNISCNNIQFYNNRAQVECKNSKQWIIWSSNTEKVNDNKQILDKSIKYSQVGGYSLKKHYTDGSDITIVETLGPTLPNGVSVLHPPALMQFIDGNIQLGTLLIHLAKQLYNSVFSEKEENTTITQETITSWNTDIEIIENLLNDIRDLELNPQDQQFIDATNNYDIPELKEEIRSLTKKQCVPIKSYEIINERLEALREDLAELESQYFIDAYDQVLYKIDNLGGGDCAVYAVQDALKTIKHEMGKTLNIDDLRQSICKATAKFLPLYELYLELERQPNESNADLQKRMDNTNWENVINYYKDIFGQDNFIIFKNIIIQEIQNKLTAEGINQESINSFIESKDSIIHSQAWNDLDPKAIKQIFIHHNTLGIDVRAALQDHKLEDATDAYYQHASQPSVWLSNNEISAYLLTLGFVYESRDTNPLIQGTCISYINSENQKLYFYNNGLDTNVNDSGAGTHWMAAIPQPDTVTANDQVTETTGGMAENTLCVPDENNGTVSYINTEQSQYINCLPYIMPDYILCYTNLLGGDA